MVIMQEASSITGSQLKGWGIDKIVFDSREAGPRTLFCALPGLHTDGAAYIADAKKRGCRSFLINDAAQAEEGEDWLYLIVSDTRQAMAQLASALYNAPSRRLKTIGVTGTDGKSTTAALICQLLELNGAPAGLISTVSFKTGAQIQDNLLRQSTPEAPQIEEALAQMERNGLQYAVIEATSHGLSPRTGRLSRIHFAAGVFTNVTIEHLEFHKTLEQYRRDKAVLFEKVAQNAAQGAFGVVNALSEHADLFVEAGAPALMLRYGRPDGQLWAENLQPEAAGTRFDLCGPHGKAAAFLPIPGLFNVENALAALLCVSRLLGKEPLELAGALEKLSGPDGRMALVQSSPFTVIVDYAHTPGAFEKLLPQARQAAKGRLLALFGSGGERNKEKRPLQGRIAGRYADVIVLADEDPRLEPPMQILEEIASGIEGKTLGQDLFLIPNRKEAMAKLFSLAQAGDTALLLGKGHESCIITAGGKEPWNEASVARELLKAQASGKNQPL